jgi:Na+/phosphate symporter
VTKLTRGSLDEREGQRAMEIISFAINLEHMGDIIDKNLSELATKKIKRRFQFSPEGAEELSAFHKRTTDSLRIAFGVFMSGDVNEARKLLAEKASLRNVELAATERHLDRLREGRPESIETSSLHSMCCATSGAFTRISVRWPIPRWNPRAKRTRTGLRKATWTLCPRRRRSPCRGKRALC